MTIHVRTMNALGALALAGLLGSPAAADDGAGRAEDRVLGGTAASIEEFPWQVALIHDGQDLHEGQFCGGSVIAPTWVLTAAHCVFDLEEGTTLVPPSSINVYWGSASLEGGGRIVDVKRTIPHEGYSPVTSDNDIALVELAEPIGAGPIRLATPDIAPLLERVGSLATVTGWGEYHPDFDAEAEAAGLSDTGAFGDRRPTELQSVALPIVDLDKCEHALSHYDPDLDEGEICAGRIRQGIDACNGDSGGPLQARDADGRFVQVGIVSWGERCSRGGYYNVYTRVSAFADWIADVMASGGEAPVATGEATVADATFGVVELAAGFVGDPVSVALAAGGGQPASKLEGSCAGYIASTPDLSLVYEAGPFALHLAVASAADTTLVVLGPDGRISCSDDVKGSNPAVELTLPLSGTYSIWVGTFERVTGPAWPDARLYISELGARFAG
jgi:secreted trypsin-like serine protease